MRCLNCGRDKQSVHGMYCNPCERARQSIEVTQHPRISPELAAKIAEALNDHFGGGLFRYNGDRENIAEIIERVGNAN